MIAISHGIGTPSRPRRRSRSPSGGIRRGGNAGAADAAGAAVERCRVVRIASGLGAVRGGVSRPRGSAASDFACGARCSQVPARRRGLGGRHGDRGGNGVGCSHLPVASRRSACSSTAAAGGADRARAVGALVLHLPGGSLPLPGPLRAGVLGHKLDRHLRLVELELPLFYEKFKPDSCVAVLSDARAGFRI